AHGPGDRPDEPAQDVEERRLPGAIRPDQAAGAGLEGHAHAVQRGHAAEADGQAVNLDHAGSPSGGAGRRGRRRSRRPSRARSLGTWSASPRGAVSSTCSTPTPNRIVSQSADTPQLLSRAGSSCSSSAAMTAPHRLYAPPRSTTASSVIESCGWKSIEYR